MNSSGKSIALLAMLTVASSAAAGPADDAMDAFQRGDTEMAFRILRPLADQGDAIAANNLGVVYEDGDGRTHDYAQALKWYRRSAQRGSAYAALNLGLMYWKDEVPVRDASERAVQVYRWCSVAAARFGEADSAPRREALAYRDRIAAEMSPEEIAEATRLAQGRKPPAKHAAK